MIAVLRVPTLFALLCAAGASWAASSPVPELAEVTGTNVGLVSAKLSEHQKGVNEIASKRIAVIARVERMAAEGRASVERELAVLKQTSGADLVKMYDALREQSDKAATVAAQLDVIEAQTIKDIGSVYTPLSISTAKLDETARTLATLGKEKTARERAVFLMSYLKEAREAVEKLKKDSEQSKQEGDKKLDEKAAKVEAPAKPSSGSKAGT